MTAVTHHTTVETKEGSKARPQKRKEKPSGRWTRRSWARWLEYLSKSLCTKAKFGQHSNKSSSSSPEIAVLWAQDGRVGVQEATAITLGLDATRLACLAPLRGEGGLHAKLTRRGAVLRQYKRG